MSYQLCGRILDPVLSVLFEPVLRAHKRNSLRHSLFDFNTPPRLFPVHLIKTKGAVAPEARCQMKSNMHYEASLKLVERESILILLYFIWLIVALEETPRCHQKYMDSSSGDDECPST